MAGGASGSPSGSGGSRPGVLIPGALSARVQRTPPVNAAPHRGHVSVVLWPAAL